MKKFIFFSSWNFVPFHCNIINVALSHQHYFVTSTPSTTKHFLTRIVEDMRWGTCQPLYISLSCSCYFLISVFLYYFTQLLLLSYIANLHYFYAACYDCSQKIVKRLFPTGLVAGSCSELQPGTIQYGYPDLIRNLMRFKKS